MEPDDLTYKALSAALKPYSVDGRQESAAFLKWFLENIYRLDEVTADDAICDAQNDKGVDGIFVDHGLQEIHVIQTKIAQNEKSTIGDVEPKKLVGSAAQLATRSSVESLLKGNANGELKKLIERQNIPDLLDKNYSVIPVFVSNQLSNKDTIELQKNISTLRVFDRTRIASEFVDFDSGSGIDKEFSFDTSYVSPLQFSATDEINVCLILASAIDLVSLEGISDARLFEQNVRLSLGNTPVNKAIAESVSDKREHKYFPLYHNGVTILCEEFDVKKDRTVIRNYMVVNGAQSLTTFFKNKSSLTKDLRVFIKIISIRDEALAKDITTKSNNQNAIKPRDLRSNHDIMLRLKAEFDKSGEPYVFEIKRGEKPDKGKQIISNEEAGRLLLAFDIGEPYTCHQIYRIFDEKYAPIFGRPEVDANRIIFLTRVMEIVQRHLPDMLANKKMASYALTRFFVLDALAHVLRSSEKASKLLSNRTELGDKKVQDSLVKAIEPVVKSLLIDLSYEVKTRGETFDFKADLKSPEKVKALRDELLRSFEKDVARGKAPSIDSVL